MTEIASKTPDRNNHKETIKTVSCFDDAKNRIHKEAKGFYEANKNNPEKIQDLRTFLGFQEEDRISLDEKYKAKRIEIKKETYSEKAKLYLYQKIGINENVKANDWGNKYRKGFIDGIASAGELAENLTDLNPDEIVENLENLDIKEHIKKGYNRLVSLKKDDVIAKMKQAWNESDGIYTMGIIVSGVGIIGKGKEIILGVKTLYEIPEYKFLEKHKDILGENLKYSDIIGEGNNAVILRHPSKNDKVIKVAKDGGDDLQKEFINHNGFLKGLDKMLIESKGTDKESILRTITIPEIKDLGGGIYEMEKINGLSFRNIIHLEYYKENLKDVKNLDTMNDFEVNKLLEERKLKTHPGTQSKESEIISKMDNNEAKEYLDFVFKLEGEWNKAEREKINPFLNIMKKEGYFHNDAHWGNYMMTNDGKIYMIDYGKSKIPNQ
ncbi:MAG: hypothetical protein PHR68_02000 [Candidatus Gracilibacteria bacterium]|nr:hypothetical protein [Candidatus Gracilibacteria bacterium]